MLKRDFIYPSTIPLRCDRRRGKEKGKRRLSKSQRTLFGRIFLVLLPKKRGRRKKRDILNFPIATPAHGRERTKEPGAWESSDPMGPGRQKGRRKSIAPYSGMIHIFGRKTEKRGRIKRGSVPKDAQGRRQRRGRMA